MSFFPNPWPVAALVLRTPRLELRPDDDAGLLELAEVAYAGVHPPEEMPFLQPWTDADPRFLGRGTLQYFWGRRAALSPPAWSLNFLVRRRSDGRVIGMQSLAGVDFGVTRAVSSGSWLGMSYQGRGLGTEMRAAVLGLAFDHLDAQAARSEAFADNPASLAVSRRLGYREDGCETRVRRGQPARMVRLLLDRAAWSEHRPAWPLEISALTDAALALLGAR
ncbi:MAG: GNAT family N-acetyltransferase [Pseudonocardia sp.]